MNYFYAHWLIFNSSFLQMLTLPVYLDYNSTTPCDPRVVDTMLPFFTKQFGNAASATHMYGWQAAEAVQLAREQVAGLINAEPGEIFFTSGATESDNLAIKGVFNMYAGKGNHIITAATEHKAVLDTCAHLEKLGANITYLPVNAEGLINLQQLEASIRHDTILIAIMYANNETGVMQPIREIGAIAKKHNVIFFTDATQAAGKIPMNVINDNIDLLALSAHKFYGPKGCGAIYVRRKGPRVKLTPLFDGGGHEKGVRSGTLNVPGIVGLGKAAALAKTEMAADTGRILTLRDHLETSLLQTGKVMLNGSVEHRLPNTTNLSFINTNSGVLMRVFTKDLAVSSGSACTSALMEPSYVLKAMGLSDELAYGSIRFSLGKFTTEEEINYVIERLKSI
ncbi:cysteine desulfurase family protein [Pseudoflavitalea rhizosphaerae]|uniref:cysteine desulfurase family protein n=1 Tax=Pseudoflavitalea rhizosphaerae TaxID=1884793 RepID=UPI001F49FDD2|nr:IscS subfamily cysteine desulfurase [Pseudoflavitalea rhizosphaerae]